MITLTAKISQRYSEAGFQVEKKSAEFTIYQNKFSIHFVFLCGNSENFADKYSRFHEHFKDDYLKGDLAPDIYWNFYEIYIFMDGSAEGFRDFKERAEMDFQMSRKYVFMADEIDNLPPLHLSLHKRKRGITESPWEEEWRDSIGEALYERIIDSPKSKIENVFKEYLNDKCHKD
jgi:hypothetical protein